MQKHKVMDFLSGVTSGSGVAILLLVAIWNACSPNIHNDAHKFCYDAWRKVYFEIFEANDFFIAVFGTYLVTTVYYWSINILFLIADITNKPEFFVRYKVQPDKNAPVHIPTLLNCVRVVMRNQILVGLPFNTLAFFALRWRGCSGHPDDLPSLNRLVLEILFFAIVEEFGFYYTHLLMHQPYFYKRIHKQHHEWTAPIGIVSLYCEKSEYVLSNMLPVVLGPLLLGSHVVTHWVWLLAALTTTTITHSGYHLPFMVSPEFHDFHHATFNNNYGVLGLLDWLHGTDKNFAQTPAYLRHRYLFSFQTIRSLYPDNAKTK